MKTTKPTNYGTTYHHVSSWAATTPVSESVCAISTTPRTLSASETSYETSCAQVRIEPSSEYFEREAQPPTMKPYAPTEPSAKMRMSAIGTSATWPSTSVPRIVQPGPNGITEKVASAVNAATKGEKMYRVSTALPGKKLSLRISFMRSAIGCSRPNG